MLFLISLCRRLMPHFARLMNPAQLAAQRFNFAFIGGFLALGQLDQFAHFFHLFQNLFEGFSNLPHFLNSVADGGRIPSTIGGGRNFQFGCGRSSGGHTGRLICLLRWRGLARTTTASTTASAPPSPTPSNA
jgi:hypothetical protein